MLEHETFGLAADLLHAETWNMLENAGIWKIVFS
jgi:hypothetical protein